MCSAPRVLLRSRLFSSWFLCCRSRCDIGLAACAGLRVETAGKSLSDGVGGGGGGVARGGGVQVVDEDEGGEVAGLMGRRRAAVTNDE